MKNRTAVGFLLILSLFLYSSCLQQLQCSAAIAGNKKTQGEALANLYKAKLKPDSSIDTSHYNYYYTTAAAAAADLLSDDDNGIGLKEKDRIRRLPGQPKHDVGFNQYGGYVTVNASAGRAFYYYFVEAVHGSKDLPLLLWLNGGPGCSSLAYGAFLELGPFRPLSDGKTLFNNPFAWNRAANVLFLESPAGVGFSYSNTTSDYKHNGDTVTAADNYAFLVNWLERFPEYREKEFYIAGESYAGHYVPQLAHNIIYHNKKSKKTIINLKGIMIGNAVINDETDSLGMYDYFVSHALISYELSHQIHKHCNFSAGASISNACTKATEAVTNSTTPIDIYNIYAPLCFDGNLTAKPKRASIYDFDPCGEYYVYAYMNNPAVQKALHANVTKVSFDWEPCSDVTGNEWTDSPSTIIPLLKEFLANGLRVWIFSGDTDGRVPVTSSQYSIEAMKLGITSTWRPWFYEREVGGYTQGYAQNLTFATVRGAGHQVPSYQPGRALALVISFLTGKPLPAE